MSQKSYFKALSLSALFFLSRTLTAVAPHKTGVETDAYGAPYAEWGVSAYTGVFLIFVLACIAFQMVQSEKPTRYDQ